MKKLLLLAVLLIAHRAFAQFDLTGATANQPSNNPPWSNILPAGSGILWSDTGIPGGIPSPGWTQSGSTILASACSNGSADCTSTIQAALNACGVNHFVLLGVGTFRINTSISIPSTCALRGAGADQTIVSVFNTSGAPINMGTGGVAYSPTNVTAGASAGSTSINVASTSGMSIGGYIAFAEQNNGTTVSIQGGEGNCNWCDGGWTSNALYASGQIVEITGISGTSISIAPALYRDYTHSPIAVPFAASAKYAGLEDLQIYDNGTFAPPNDGQDVSWSKCAYCWVKGVEFNYTGGDWIDIYWSYRGEIRNNYMSNAYRHTSGSHDSDISLLNKTTGTQVVNNIIERGHASVLMSWGAAGNVVAYNYAHGGLDEGSQNFVVGGFGMHGAHPQFNLWEGNVAPALNPDQIWGSNSFNTMFRNWAEGTTLACLPLTGRATVTCSPVGQYGGSGVKGWWPFQASRAMELTHLSTYDNLVGNVAGSANQAALKPYGNPLAGSIPSLAWNTTPPNPTRSYDSYNYNMDFGYGESNDDGTGTGCAGSTNPPCHSTAAFTTGFLQCNYTYANSTTSACPNFLPPSFYLSAAPAWWGSLAYPAIGPDITGQPGGGGHAGLIPAQNCYLNIMGGTEGGAGSPLSFNEQTCYNGL